MLWRAAPHLLGGGRLWPWRFGDYGAPEPAPAGARVRRIDAAVDPRRAQRRLSAADGGVAVSEAGRRVSIEHPCAFRTAVSAERGGLMFGDVRISEGDRPRRSRARPDVMDTKIVLVVGASGTLGADIVKAVLAKGAVVRAMVRATSSRAKLESLGVTDFVVADLNDPASLRRAMTAEPRVAAVVASAAGFTAHSARTKADNSRTRHRGVSEFGGRRQRRGRASVFADFHSRVRQGPPGFPISTRSSKPKSTWPRNASRILRCAPGLSWTEPKTSCPNEFAKGFSPTFSPASRWRWSTRATSLGMRPRRRSIFPFPPSTKA